MITNFVNKLYKRKYLYKTYSASDLNNCFDSTLSSPLLREGNVSLKFIANNKQINKYLTLPTCFHYPLNKFENVINLPKMTTFQAELDCNNFFTLNLLANNTLEKMTNEIKDVTGENEYFVMNLVIQKVKKQTKMFLRQYEHFSKGVEVPSSNPIVSAIQKYCLDEDDRIYIPMPIVDMIEHKVMDQHFKFQLFFGMKYESKEKEVLVEGVLRNTLDEFSHLNTVTLNKIKYDEDVFKADELIYQYSKYYISLSELNSMTHRELQVDEINVP